jgi:hypothetical protein
MGHVWKNIVTWEQEVHLGMCLVCLIVANLKYSILINCFLYKYVFFWHNDKT